jgi:hypothetical protein
MSTRAPKIALGIGIGLIVLCVGAGIVVSRHAPDGRSLEAAQRRFDAFNRLQKWTNVEAEAFARDVAAMNALNPKAVQYVDGMVYVMFPLEPSLVDKIFSPGTRTYRPLPIRDFDGSFEKRLNSSLSQLGAFVKASGRSPAHYRPNFGRLEIRARRPERSSTNPLEYLDFTLHP